MSWTPDYLSDPMRDVLDRMRDGWELDSRQVPPSGIRYWLHRPARRNSPRVGVETVTIEALRRRGLI